MIVYLTFGDQPSGVYRSQVEDLVLFLRTKTDQRIRLVTFISLHGFFENRNKIKRADSEAIVLPMWPRLANWNRNSLLLNFLLRRLKPDRIIARSVLATNLALDARQNGLIDKVIYDGRGAIGAEWSEYNVVTDENLKTEIFSLERRAVTQSDKQIAVSNKLVEYWIDEFKLEGNEYVVIPCTLSEAFVEFELSEERISQVREKLGFTKSDVVLVYSGSTAGWQSIKELIEFLSELLRRQDNLKLLFLSKRTEVVDSLIDRFKSRVQQTFVKPEEVPQYLAACDYGLLIREKSVTNKVASPVKFAEYLACGLKVIISKGIGDYSDLIEQTELGFMTDKLPKTLESESLEGKKWLRKECLKRFTKDSYQDDYLSL